MSQEKELKKLRRLVKFYSAKLGEKSGSSMDVIESIKEVPGDETERKKQET